MNRCDCGQARLAFAADRSSIRLLSGVEQFGEASYGLPFGDAGGDAIDYAADLESSLESGLAANLEDGLEASFKKKGAGDG